jgi:hypothetical protein
MSIESIKNLIESGKTVSFYMTPDTLKEHGIYTCQVSAKDDEHLVFANTLQTLCEKMGRRDFVIIPVKPIASDANTQSDIPDQCSSSDT